jgi:hypothetical protein
MLIIRNIPALTIKASTNTANKGMPAAIPISAAIQATTTAMPSLSQIFLPTHFGVLLESRPDTVISSTPNAPNGRLCSKKGHIVNDQTPAKSMSECGRRTEARWPESMTLALVCPRRRKPRGLIYAQYLAKACVVHVGHVIATVGTGSRALAAAVGGSGDRVGFDVARFDGRGFAARSI